MPQLGERANLRRDLAALLRLEGAIMHRLRTVQAEAKAVQRELRKIEMQQAEASMMRRKGISKPDGRTTRPAA